MSDCIVHKSEVLVNKIHSDKILVKLYGVEKQYCPLYSEYLIKWIFQNLEKALDIQLESIDILTHLSDDCVFVLPASSWITCNFTTEYKKHCDSMLDIDPSMYKYIVPLDINDVIEGSYSINNDNIIRLNTFSILSEWYFKVRDNTVHFTELDDTRRTSLYAQLSISYRTTITDSSNLDVDSLDISSNDKIILIPSILNITNNNPLRTIYTQEERFEQTLKQVKSIHNQYGSGMKPIILELSYMSLRQIQKLAVYCKGIIFFNKDPKAYEYSIHQNKNIAEVYLLKFMYEKLKDTNYSHISKFGGRYSISKNFNKDQFFKDKPVFRYIGAAYDGKPVYESIFYSIPRKYHTRFEEVLTIMENTLKMTFTDVEHLLYTCFQKMGIESYHIEKLGIKGCFAGSGIYNSS